MLEAHKLDHDAANKYGSSRKRMAVSFRASERYSFKAHVRGEDHAEHGGNSCQPENGDHHGYTQPVPFYGRVNEDRDQGFTGAEDKNGKKDPRGEIGPLGFMNMNVLPMVYVRVCVCLFVLMNMEMGVGPVPYRLAHSPDKINEAEHNEGPSRDMTSEGIERLHPGYSYTKVTPRIPSMTALRTCPRPLRTVTQLVLAIDHFFARAITVNGM